MPPNGEDRPQEALPGLLMLRRGLSGGQLRFPLFDFACIWYYHQTKRLSSARLASLFPTDELTVLGAIADVISKHSYGTLASAVINVFSKHFQDRALMYWKERNLKPADISRIQELSAESESYLLDELPAYFARDLNSSMDLKGSPKRVVLFFDTHEAFWGLEKRNLGYADRHRQDQWFRCLLNTLQPEKGIVVVVGGREIPGWSKARKHPIPDSNVEYRLIGNLPQESAQEYLRHVNVTDPALRDVVCRFTAVEPGEVHPLFLGLCADIILEASDRGLELPPDEFARIPTVADVGSRLKERLLQSVDQETADAVVALSASRAFDRDIYFKLASALHFNGTDHAFRKVTSFSFVSPAEGRSAETYKIHELLRRLIHDSSEELERRAHEVLEEHYRQIGGPAAVAEALYHASRLDLRRAVQEWVEHFDAALWASDYSICRALLAVRPALAVDGPRESGMLARCEADFLRVRALYSDSDREYKRAIKYLESAQRTADDIDLKKQLATLLLNHGTLQSELSQFPAAVTSYKKALEICDLVLVVSNDVEAYAIKAETHLGMGDASIWASRSRQALDSYSAGVAVCDQALAIFRRDDVSASRDATMRDAIVNFLNDKAYGLSGIGDIESGFYRHKAAIQRYVQAEVCYDDALSIKVDPVVRNDRAFNSVSIAESEIALEEYAAASDKCRQAAAVYDELIRSAPEDIIYEVNKSRALRLASISLSRTSRYKEARQVCQEAIAICAEVLDSVPTDTWALTNRGLGLLSLCEVYIEEQDFANAKRTSENSRASFERLLAETPEDDEALAGKGRALFWEGEALRMTGQAEAIEKYRQSAMTFERALEDAAEDADTRNDKARALESLGELYLAAGRREEALDAIREAVRASDQCLEIAPEHKLAREARHRQAALLSRLDMKVS
jgi:tetratricopeptide (TPR) repeat protein